MLSTKALRLAFGELLAADVATLAPAAANKIALFTNNVAVNENNVIGDFTLATFTGGAAKAGAAGAQQAGVDPITGQQVITNLAPAGGWRWECTVAPLVPETIRGFILTDNAGAVLLAMAVLGAPITISAVGDFVDLGAVTLTIPRFPLT